MLPSDLKAEQFAGYPPKARKLVVAHLATLQQLPLGFVPSLLRELIDYDFKFPAERISIDHELATLSSLSPAQLKEWFQAFSQLSLSSKFEKLDWVNQPAQFVEQLSSYLWTTHQLNAFREAAIAYGNRTRLAPPAESTAIPPLGIAVIGQGVQSYDEPLFRNLRKHGTYFKQVKPENGVQLLMAAVEARAKAHPVPYGHWYVDGGQPAEHSPSLSWNGSRGTTNPHGPSLSRRPRNQWQGRRGDGPF
jgi:hypothetical protein